MKIIPKKEQWEKWSLISKVSYISAYIGVLGLIIGVLSLNNSIPIIKIKEKNIIAIRKANYEINKSINEKEINVYFPVELVSGKVILEEKAEIIEIEIDKSYLFGLKEYAVEPKIEINDITLSKKSLTNINETEYINIKFEQKFIFIDPIYSISSNTYNSDIKFGKMKVRIYYLNNNREEFCDVDVLMLFV